MKKIIIQLTILFLTITVYSQEKGLNISVMGGISQPMGSYKTENVPDITEDRIGAVYDFFGYDKTRKGNIFYNLDANYRFGKFGMGISLGSFSHEISEYAYHIPFKTSFEGGHLSGTYYGIGPNYNISFSKLKFAMMLRAGMVNYKYDGFKGFYAEDDVTAPVNILETAMKIDAKTSMAYSSVGIKLSYPITKHLDIFTKFDYLITLGKGLEVEDTYYLPVDMNQNDTISAFDVAHFTIIDLKREQTRFIKPAMLHVGVGLSYNIPFNKPKRPKENFSNNNEEDNSFKNDVKSISCDAPRLVSPENNKVYIDTKAKKDTKASFKWQKNKNINSYDFKIFDKNNKMVFNKRTSKNELKVDLAKLDLEKGLYSWKVIINTKDCGKKESKPNAFFYNKSYTYTAVVLTQNHIECGDGNGNNYDSNGNVLYHGYFTLENISTSNASVNYNPGFVTANNNGSLSQTNPFTAFPKSLPPGASWTYHFKLTIPVGTTSVHIETTGQAADGDVEIEGFDASLPACVCEVCDQWVIRTDKQPTINVHNAYGHPAYMTISDHLQVQGSDPIKEVQADIAYFQYVSENDECLQCTPDDVAKGKFFTNTPNRPTNFRNTPWKTYGEAYYRVDGVATQVSSSQISNNNLMVANSINWLANVGQEMDLSTPKPVRFDIGLPNQSKLECCKDLIKVCIRYTFVDKNCNICEKLVCYRIVRTKPNDNGGVSTSNNPKK